MKRYPPYKYILAVLDWGVISTAFIAALKLHLPYIIEAVSPRAPFFAPEVLFFLGYAMIVVLIFHYNNLYKINVFLTVVDQALRIFKALFYAALGVAILSFYTKSQIIVDSRLTILYFMLISFGLLLFLRVFLFRRLFLFLTKNHLYHRTLLIVGAGTTGRLLAANLNLKNSYGLRIIGFVDDEKPVGSTVFRGFKVLGGVVDAPRLVHEHNVDEVLICPDNASHERLFDILDICRKTGTSIKIASPLYEVIPARIFTERYGEVPVVAVFNTVPNPLQKLSKRAFDLVLATIGLLLLSPLFAVIALAIKLDSRGPVLFKQTRIGKDGKPFQFYKFRSMYLGSDTDEARKHRFAAFIRSKKNSSSNQGSTKIVDEFRITRVGKFIRKTSLDELPQLINVLKGEMSLVGPRPCLPYEWEHYETWHKKRLSITPGCTGVWQVSGRSEVGFEDMVILDLYYIHNAWWLLDLQILLKTIPVMIFGRGGK